MDEAPQILVEEDDSEARNFARLFGDDQDRQYSIRVARLDPKELDGVRIFGYCGTLPYGEDIEYILKTWGGGSYSIQQYKGNTYIQSRKIVIAGLPKLSSPLQGRPPLAVGNPTPEIGSLGESDELYFRRLRRLMLEKKLLDSLDSNPSEKLLEIMIQKLGLPVEAAPQTDAMESALKMIEGMARLREALPSESAGDGGGMDFMGLLGKAIDVIPQLAVRNAASQAKIPAGQIRAADVAPKTPPAQISAPPPQTVPEAPAVTNPFTVAQTAIGTVVQAFLEEPPLDPDRTVNMLRALIDFTPEVIEQLQKYRTALYDGAVVALHTQIDSDLAEDERFRLFFENVFSILVSEPNPNP